MSLFSCKKVTTKKVDKYMSDGSWKITKYSDDGVDETSQFSAYTFTFDSNGTVSTGDFSGTWSTSEDNSNDDSNSDVDFNIAFAVSNNLDDLTDDWEITSQTKDKLELQDVSGGNGGTDYLTFEKK
jgi:hypothetical protein